MPRRSRSAGVSTSVTSGSPVDPTDRPNADAHELCHVPLVVPCLPQDLYRVPREHVDHPFPRCLVQRVCEPKGSAQSGQNFRKRGGQNLRNPQRRRPHRKVVAFVAEQPLDLLYISTVTLAEIRFGIELVVDANRRAELTGWLVHKVRPLFAQRVLDVSEDVIVKWRLLVEQGRKSGYTFSQPALFIAATALHHGMTVV
jgi:predicted nucleic acid-binding protein